MTTWADLRNALRTAVRTAATDAGVVNAAVAWGDEQRPTAKRLVLLDVVSAVALHDRETDTAVPEETTTAWALSSLYSVALQVRCETIDHGPSVDALFVLERLRASLRRPSIADALRAACGAAFEWPLTQSVNRISFPFDGRTVSSFSFETEVRVVLDFAPEDELGTTLRAVVVEGESATPDDDTPAETDLEVAAPSE